MKLGLADWNTRSLEEDGLRRLRDADGASSQWDSKRGKYWGGKHSLSTFSMETSTMDDVTQYACCCVLLKTYCAAFYFVALSIKMGSIQTEEQQRNDRHRRILRNTTPVK